MKGRDYARERSEISRKVRPLGQFIVDQIHNKVGRPLSIPPVVPSRDIPPVCSASKQVRRSGKETPVLHDCLRWLRRHGIFAWRNNTGTAWLGGQPVSFGYPGSSDIIGLVPATGRFLAIECKSATGKQRKKQKVFQAKIEQNHGFYLLVRSEEELACLLKPYL